jgi:hypothetical protein
LAVIEPGTRPRFFFVLMGNRGMAKPNILLRAKRKKALESFQAKRYDEARISPQRDR